MGKIIIDNEGTYKVESNKFNEVNLRKPTKVFLDILEEDLKKDLKKELKILIDKLKLNTLEKIKKIIFKDLNIKENYKVRGFKKVKR